MTELGIYILGATALGILAAAGIASGNHTVLLCAVISSGAAYVAQGAAEQAARDMWVKGAVILNNIGLAVALLSWLAGVLYL